MPVGAQQPRDEETGKELQALGYFDGDEDEDEEPLLREPGP